MGFGDGRKYGDGLTFGNPGRGLVYGVRGGMYFTIDWEPWELMEPYIEPLPPVELRWTLMNTSWKKGKRR